MSLLSNYPLFSALSAIILAQFIKVPVFLIVKRTWDAKLAFSTGGMPSSHSAAVASLSTAIGISDGISSTAFAIAVVLSAITMFDAAGIRRHAGNHAFFLNRMINNIPGLFKETSLDETLERRDQKDLKELLGHKPIEVFVGGMFGIVIAIMIHYLLY